MKANPGGQIDIKEVVGRDQLIEQIWDTLEQQSVRMNAERRIGKTTIIKKLAAEPRDGWVPIFQDLGKCHTALEFAYEVYRDVEQYLSKAKRTARKARELLKSLGGAEVGGVIKLPNLSTGVPWKEILTKSIQDLVSECDSNATKALFLWDEVPFMLSNIKEREGERVAMEVLDTLRGLRQHLAGTGLRMILTGSIGIHHVLKGLKQKNYANSPLNDTYVIEVPPLSLEAASRLALKLIQGEEIKAQNPEESAAAIAQVADGLPYYIHHIVKALKISGLDGEPGTVEKVVQRQMMDPNDPWKLSHYRERVPVYYGKQNEPVVLAILDSVAVCKEVTSLDALLSELKGMGVLDDREQLMDLLRLIEQDHYLTRNSDGYYYFQFPLLRRWWKLARSL